MKVSVVIPLYNKARHIRRAIDSVLAQTRPPDEVVVVDDGSTDGSAQMVAEIQDPRIRLIAQSNGGVSAARNRGVQEASGDGIAFLDADDEWNPSFLETVTGLRDRFPKAGIYATSYRLCDGKRVWRPAHVDSPADPQGGLMEDYFRSASGPAPFCSSSVMIPKPILNEVGLFPNGMAKGEDLCTWARIALRHPVAWSPQIGATYHLAADNRACGGVPPEPDLWMALALEKELRNGEEPISPRGQVEEYLASMRLDLARTCYLAGRNDWARGLLAKTRGTKAHRRKRRLLRGLVWIPPGIGKRVLSLGNLMSRLKKLGKMAS